MILKKLLKNIPLLYIPVILASFLYVSIIKGEEYHSNPSLKEWIPWQCCVTNDCCWKISEKEVTPLSNGDYVINSTGQRMSYKGSVTGEVGSLKFSTDQSFYRCACDHDKDTSKWIRHQGAHSRCLFIPNRGF